jgi:hypothetical protein
MTTKRSRKRNRITNEQRRHLFALGRGRGLDLAQLRDLTPTGSVAALSRSEADQLIDRLAVGLQTRRPRPLRGKRATAGQLRLIADLIQSTAVSSTWLSRFGVAGIADVREHATAQRIIGALSSIQRSRDPSRICKVRIYS